MTAGLLSKTIPKISQLYIVSSNKFSSSVIIKEPSKFSVDILKTISKIFIREASFK